VATTPMGHLSYAIQWFAFATIALVIYGLALRKKSRADTLK
jgi:cytochrome oxidase assembly protein ShyY1